MSELVLQTRITPPSTNPNIVRRKRLLDLLNQNANKSLILVSGSAGYGKTTLVQEFLHNYVRDYAWFYVSPDINNFYTFIFYLINALKMLNNKFGSQTLNFLDSIKQRPQFSVSSRNVIKDAVANFINEYCEKFKNNITLVIDDIHNTEGEWLTDTFDQIIENFPENLHIILTSRTRPAINLTRLNSKRQLFILETKDLEFTRDEIAELLDKAYSLKYSDEDIAVLEEKLRGWITGIHLILQAYGKDFNKIKSESKYLPENIFDFFANEIFKSLPSEIQAFLLGTAILDNFGSDICNKLLGITNSAEIIDELSARNIFIQHSSHSGNRPEYNYHVLFQKFLMSKLYSIRSENEIRNLRKKICNYFLKTGDEAEAMLHAVEAGDTATAVNLIEKNFQKLFEEGKYEILWRCISKLTDAAVKGNAGLLYFKSQLYKYFAGDLEKSLEYITDAINISEKEKGGDFLVDCYVSKAQTLLFFGKTEEVIKDLENIVNIKMSAESRAKVLFWLASASYRYVKYDQSISYLNKSLEICTELKLTELKTDIYHLLGNIYTARGEFVKALSFYEGIIENESNVYKKFLTYNNLVTLQACSGNYEKAKEYWDKTSELFKLFPATLDELYMLRSEALFRFEAGDLEESIRLLKRVNAKGIKSNIQFYIYLSYMFIGECYYLLDKLDLADQYYDLAIKYIDEKNEYQKIEFKIHKAILHKRTEPDTAIETDLLEVFEFYNKHNLLYSRTQIEFYLADYYLRCRQFETALNYLRNSLKISSEKQYVSFLEQHVPSYRYIFDIALQEEMQPDFVKEILHGFLKKRDYEWLSVDSRVRTEKEIEDFYDVNMRTFGGLDFKIRGKEIPAEKWVRKKSKLIFAYLLLNSNSKLTKDKIVDIFFSESSGEAKDVSFHKAISNLRAATKITQPLADIDIVIYEEKTLRLNPNIYMRSDAAEFEKLYRAFKSLNGQDKLSKGNEALKLYAGEFLDGYYDSWCENLRQDYSNMFVNVCEELADISFQKHLFENAAGYWEKLISHDKLNEKAYVSTIESYALLGRMNAAKEKFDLMIMNYEDGLGEKPPDKILDRIKAILKG